jgi:tetratricopeptide (TPR) repeat protein
MASKRRKLAGRPPGAGAARGQPASGATAGAPGPAAPPKRISRKQWAARGLLALLAPLVVLGLVEGGLRFAGVGYPTAFWVRQPHSSVCTDNSKFVWQFYSPKTNLKPNPFAVQPPKPAATVRIVVLGESAAAGTPEPAYSFGRVLERMLRDRFPQRRVEVINAAMRGVNSHVLVQAARDCAELEPDLFVIYMGNNEVVGLHAPGPNSGWLTAHLRLLRATQRLRSSRVGQLLFPLTQRWNAGGVAGEKQDAAFFRAHRLAADDPRRAAVYANFRANLEEMLAAAEAGRARAVVSGVAVNLGDCPPLGSLHRTGIAAADLAAWEAAYRAGAEAEQNGNCAAARERYQAALKLDDHFAELHFRLARCCRALGEHAEAARHFTLANEWDALQFRAHGPLNRIAEEVAQARRERGVEWVDAARGFADSELSDHGVPGARLFYDHVHLNFDGTHALASALYPAVVRALGGSLGSPARGGVEVLSRDECARRLAFTRVDEAQATAAMLRMTGDPPFTEQYDQAERQRRAGESLTNRFSGPNQGDLDRAVESYRAAMKLAPDDWQLGFSLARLLFSFGRYGAAVEYFEATRDRLPHCVAAQLGLSATLDRLGRKEEALAVARAARRLDPLAPEVAAALAALNGP